MNKSKSLVIVESPAKAKTIEKYLGPGYTVMASYGHVRDLKPKQGAVDTNNDFAMQYTIIEKNARHMDAIIKAFKSSDNLLLATDPDREGEAISWHVYEVLKEKKLIKDKSVQRIFFNEITKSAVQAALKAPRDIAMDLVNAQQARRALDYLVGFNLSPLLWKKVRRGLSAGRVQSPALRLIVEREEEIKNFVQREYWHLEALCEHTNTKFIAKLTHYLGKKLDTFYFENEEMALQAKNKLETLAKNGLVVTDIEKKQRKRNPYAPFITSTLQQEASRKLGFTARKTMSVAQQLYEGIDIGSGTAGLITYMRTDSVNISKEAIEDMRDYINQKFGKDFLPTKARVYKTKSKNAQEAHEAIRPTLVSQTPDALKSYLSSDQYKLYQLIWKRAVASQMAEALIDTTAINLSFADNAEFIFRANGSVVVFPGFLSLYEESFDDPKNDNEEGLLPLLELKNVVAVNAIEAKQHFTEPPPRYTEASLVKTLEEFDIGRPSTYASIIHTLQQREYVIIDKKRFLPTDVGCVVSGFLKEYFTQYVDYKFTAGLEDTLDAISRGEKAWVPVLENFWKPFVAKIQSIDSSVARTDVTSEIIEELCPKCGKQLAMRLGKRGKFIGCTGYPQCDYTKDAGDNSNENSAEKLEPVVVEDRKCELCGSDLHIKSGRYGKFIGCSNYPKCKHIEPLEKPMSTEVSCPKCNDSMILKRKSRWGKIFYSCGAYPKCTYAIWNEPLPEPCPKCAWPILTIKETKRYGKEMLCPQPGCGYKKSM